MRSPFDPLSYAIPSLESSASFIKIHRLVEILKTRKLLPSRILFCPIFNGVFLNSAENTAIKEPKYVLSGYLVSFYIKEQF